MRNLRMSFEKIEPTPLPSKQPARDAWSTGNARRRSPFYSSPLQATIDIAALAAGLFLLCLIAAALPLCIAIFLLLVG